MREGGEGGGGVGIAAKPVVVAVTVAEPSEPRSGEDKGEIVGQEEGGRRGVKETNESQVDFASGGEVKELNEIQVDFVGGGMRRMKVRQVLTHTDFIGGAAAEKLKEEIQCIFFHQKFTSRKKRRRRIPAAEIDRTSTAAQLDINLLVVLDDQQKPQQQEYR